MSLTCLETSLNNLRKRGISFKINRWISSRKLTISWRQTRDSLVQDSHRSQLCLLLCTDWESFWGSMGIGWGWISQYQGPTVCNQACSHIVLFLPHQTHRRPQRLQFPRTSSCRHLCWPHKFHMLAWKKQSYVSLLPRTVNPVREGFNNPSHRNFPLRGGEGYPPFC